MKYIIPWILGFAALGIMYAGWYTMNQDIERSAEELATRYENMSDEERVEDLLHRQARFHEGLGVPGSSDEIDDMLARVDDPAVAARAKKRKAERAKREADKQAALAAQQEGESMVFLWVALIGLIGIIIGAGIGAFLLMRAPKPDEGTPA